MIGENNQALVRGVRGEEAGELGFWESNMLWNALYMVLDGLLLLRRGTIFKGFNHHLVKALSV